MKDAADITITTFGGFADLGDLVARCICDAVECVPVEGVDEVKLENLRNFQELERYWKLIRTNFYRDTNCGKDIDVLLDKLRDGQKTHRIELQTDECRVIWNFLEYFDPEYICENWPVIGMNFVSEDWLGHSVNIKEDPAAWH